MYDTAKIRINSQKQNSLPSYSAFRKTLIFTHKEKRKFLYYKKKFLV